MKELTYSDLLNMEGQEVWVKLVSYDYIKFRCKVVLENVICSKCGCSYTEVSLVDDKLKFSYNTRGNCESYLLVYAID
jgi:hypothetical protein